jgi:phosphate transport system substrate-binding protein
VLADKYKLARPFLFVTKGPPKPDAQAFIDFVLSPEAQKTLESEGLIRAKKENAEANATRQAD